MVAVAKSLPMGHEPASPLLTLEEFYALPEGPPDREFEEGKLIDLTSEGYLAIARVAAGGTFQPQLFPALRINLANLLGEPVEFVDVGE